MEKKQYKAPEFRFQELFLFEGVADTCWGFQHADFLIFFDADRDDSYDSGEEIIFQHDFVPSDVGGNQGCKKVEDAIDAAIEDIHQRFITLGYEKYWPKAANAIQDRTNAGSSSSVYIPVHS